MPADPKPEKQSKTTPKPRGPVNYLAFAEYEPGAWALVAYDRESSSVYALRKELRQELSDAQAEGGRPVSVGTKLVIIPTAQAHIIEAAQRVEVKETYQTVKLKDVAVLSSLFQERVPLSPEAEVAARMGAGEPPELEPEAEQAAGAAHAAALAAEAGARQGQALPLDPDDDEDHGNPDIDPATGLSRRPASEARPEDEGRTVFPVDE